jgi:electron transfer flavoprotein beta subunit
MKIGVCVKKVPDTETRIKIGADEKHIVMDGVSFILSPYDEYAIEEALQIKERLGQGEVVLITVGDDEAVKILRNGLAMGADRAVQVHDPAVHLNEPYDVARVLAQVIRTEGLQIVLFGKQGVGQDFQQVPALVAEILQWPQVSVITKLELNGEELTAHREIEGGEEIVGCRLPAVISTQKGLNTPRYASLKGIMAAKKKTVEAKTLGDLGLSPLTERSWEIVRLEMPPSRPAGRLLEGEPEEQVRQLVELLHSEAKVL